MVELKVCIGSACHVNGAHNVVATFQHMIEDLGLHDKVELAASFCMKACSGKGVSVTVDGKTERISAEGARAFFREQVLPLTE